MLIVGLTGSIATGKSTVSSTLAGPPYSIPVIDADVVARRVVEPGTRGYSSIVQHFGSSTPDLLIPASDVMPENGPDGRGRPLDRGALGRRIFGDSEEGRAARAALNGIVHPAVRLEIAKSVVWYYLTGHWAVVLDIPLLFESQLSLFCGAVVVVAVRDPATQLGRLMARDGPRLSRQDAEDRIKSQTDIATKARRCQAMGSRGIVLWNDGPVEELQAGISRAVGQLRARCPGWWSWLLLGFPPLAAAAAAVEFWRNRAASQRWECDERARDEDE